MHVAARLDRPEIIRLLRAKGADLSARGQWDGTALHWACWWGSKKSAELLVEMGLDLEDKGDVFRSSPLLWAAHGSANNTNSTGDYSATVSMLLDRGALPDTRNGEGVPAVIMASEEIAEMLIAAGARRPTTRPAVAYQMV